MAEEWAVFKEIFPHLTDGYDDDEYSEWHSGDYPRCIAYKGDKPLPKNYCFKRFGDCHLEGTYPGIEVVGFYACDKNFGCYNMSPGRFPDAKVFIIYSSPADGSVQYRFKDYEGKVIVDHFVKRFFEPPISDKIVIVWNVDDLRREMSIKTVKGSD